MMRTAVSEKFRLHIDNFSLYAIINLEYVSVNAKGEYSTKKEAADNTSCFEKSKLSQNSETINRRHKMKATGIVRRIDDLGRVVIPKEIRRTLRIRMGDPSLKH